MHWLGAASPTTQLLSHPSTNPVRFASIRNRKRRRVVCGRHRSARRWRRSIGGRVHVTVYSGQIGCTQHSYSGGSNLITPRWAFTTLDSGKRHLSRARPLTTNCELHSERIHLATSGMAKVVLMLGQRASPPLPSLRVSHRSSCCFDRASLSPLSTRDQRFESPRDRIFRREELLTVALPSSTERNRLERVGRPLFFHVISRRFIFSMGQENLISQR